MREIVFDKETTGFGPGDGPRGFRAAKVATQESMR
jgi:hypothetical protein